MRDCVRLCVLLVTFVCFCRAEDESGLVLRNEVEVSGELVLLSDLLPANAPENLANSASKVQLCRAPRVGSKRGLSRGAVLHLLENSQIPASAMRIPEQIVISRRGTSIPVEGVHMALDTFFQQQGWIVPGREIAFDVPLTESRTAAPQLAVSGSHWDSATKKLEVRMGCFAKTDCGSFLLRIPLEHSMVTSRAIRGEQSSIRHIPPTDPVLTLAGKQATLLLEGDGIRLILPVVSLTRGRLWQRIKVRETVHHREFSGEVIGPSLVRASF